MRKVSARKKPPQGSSEVSESDFLLFSVTLDFTITVNKLPLFGLAALW